MPSVWENLNREFFHGPGARFVKFQREGQRQQLRLAGAHLACYPALPGWDEVEMTWTRLARPPTFADQPVRTVQEATSLYADGLNELEDVISDMGNATGVC